MGKRKFDRTSSWRCVEYWIARGHTLEEALKHISNKQSLISANQKGKTVSKTAKDNMRQAALKRNTDEYWVDRYGNDAKEHQNKYKQQLSANGKKSIQKRDNNTSTPRRSDFWIKRGCSQEEAKVKVSETQATFSLKKCIKRYGNKIGQQTWENRQKKWRRSFEQNDQNKINVKRRQHAHVGFYNLKNIPIGNLKFYVLLIEKESERWFKYGLTKHNVIKRWGNSGTRLTYTILYESDHVAKQAIEIETLLRKKFGTQHESQNFNLTELVPLKLKEEMCTLLRNYSIKLKEINYE